jgi:hypothetical protein
MTMPINPPAHRTAAFEEAGRPCPYCRFPLKQGEQVSACGACSAVQHSDCWRENGGCSVLGCAGARDSTLNGFTAVTAPGATASWTTPPVAPPPPAFPPPAPPPYQTGPLPTPAPVAFAPTPPPIPIAPPAPRGGVRSLSNGATVKIRNPWAVLALSIVTLGIYTLFWWYETNRELRDYGRAQQAPGLGDSPGGSLAAYALGGFGLFIPMVWTIVGTTRRVQRAQTIAGMPSRLSGGLAAVLWILTGGWGAIVYQQSELNRLWRQVDGAPVGAPAAASGRTLMFAAAVVFLAIAIAGTTTAIILTRAEEETGAAAIAPPSVDATESDPAPEPESTPFPEPTEEPEPTDTNGVLPDVDESTMEEDITSMLTDWHVAVVDGDFSTAWDLLTERKRRQKERDEGYAAWESAQASLGKYLEPDGLSTSIISTDESTGVVTVRVSGMGWTNPSSPCSQWEGISWVRYEDDAWHYDPGYSTTPQRERKWKNRYDELMGVGC